MVTFPAGMSEQERAFAARQHALRERLRWLDPRSRRARKLQKELADITRAELRRETAPQPSAPKEAKQQWWQE
ncbi:hypothetical protein SAMN05428936_101660 [Pelagibacterium halotolerans]|uniref:Uncharacterized protein n=2 Tax=Pelagibacterium TaxID=1082930 RepID=G4RDE7_PELHB|nr:hypothetical protein KKY_734 [Pelagibacterium halotolerans B2]SDZ95472.1 hypothetical protein SAMN05428936_101660 [Pelagibacterium halotolerans]